MRRAMLPVFFLLPLLSLLLVGCQDATAPQPTGFTITGTVVDEYFNPRPRSPIYIPGHETVLTDESGRFSIDGVSPPYDLHVAIWYEGAMVYVGLTRTDDLTVIVPANQYGRLPNQSQVSGRILYPFWDYGAVIEASVFFESPEARASTNFTHDSYYLGVAWRGADTTTGTLHALQWRIPGGMAQPDSFRYGRLTDVALSGRASVQASGSLDQQRVGLSAIPLGRVTGEVAVPEGYVATEATITAGFLDSGARSGWRVNPAVEEGPTFDFVTPDLPSARFAVTARAANGQAWSQAVVSDLDAFSSGVTVDIPAAPRHRTPEAEFADVDLVTPFAWSRTAEEAIYLVAFRSVDDRTMLPRAPNVYVLTKDTTATLPDIRPLWMSFAQTWRYAWEVHAYAPVGSMDEILGEGWFFPRVDGSVGSSGPRMFRICEC